MRGLDNAVDEQNDDKVGDQRTGDAKQNAVDCRLPLRLHAFFVRSYPHQLIAHRSTSDTATRHEYGDAARENSLLHEMQILQPSDALRHDAMARMICLRGFRLEGDGLAHCFDGRLLREVGECLPKDCKLPPYSRLTGNRSTLPHAKSAQLYCISEEGGGVGSTLTVTCSFGQIHPAPNCQKFTLSHCISPIKSGGNEPALAFHAADDADSNASNEQSPVLFLDRFQPVFPNGTVIRFKCEDESNGSGNNSSGAAASPSHHSLPAAPTWATREAGSVQCVDGEWHSKLLLCVPPEHPSSRSASALKSVRKAKTFFGQRDVAHCTAPKINASMIVGNLDERFFANSMSAARTTRPNAILSDKNNNSGRMTSLPAVSYPHGTVLEVRCAHFDMRGRAEQWKCRRSKWQQKNRIDCPSEVGMCEYKVNASQRVSAFYKQGQEFVLFNQKFPHASKLSFSCVGAFLERLRGASEVECRDGEWVPGLPHCARLDAQHSNAEPPPVHFEVENGGFTVSPEGVLLLNRSTTLRLFCLYPKRLGQPKWETSSTYRSYPQSWAKVGARQQLEGESYCLTISMVQPEDGGFFYCILPDHRRTSVQVEIRDEKCDLIERRKSPHLHVHYTQRHLYLGTIAQFSCAPGYRVDSGRSLICLRGGRWSHFPPKCQAAQCPPLGIRDEQLSCTVTSYKFGGLARCYCRAEEYRLFGASSLHCGFDGKWSESLPHCKVITCDTTPPLPMNARILNHATSRAAINTVNGVIENSNALVIGTSRRFRVDDFVIYGCESGYMLTGSDFIVCQADGAWSRLHTRCESYCRFPGEIRYGQATNPPKFYYLTGEKVVYYCTRHGYRLDSDNVLECLEAGRWSRPRPKCVTHRKRTKFD